MSIKINKAVLKKMEEIPDACGVYIFKSSDDKILYIGKAVSLRKRVRSHFRSSQYIKDAILMEKVADIDYIVCENEEQALLLEANLIKEKKPYYNVSLRDDKSYPYLLISADKFARISVARPKKLKKGEEKIGPFTSSRLLKKALIVVRKIFPYCSCKKPHRNCLYYHLKLCPGPEITSVSLKKYRENISSIKKIFSGQKRKLLKDLEKKMKKLADLQKYEEAAEVRDKILSLYSIYSGKREASELLLLQKLLNLKRIPFHIEAIDIASLSGKECCGSVVVFLDGKPHKASYRRYKIKLYQGINDYAMLSEVVLRRYRRLKEEKKQLPDLIVVDGGPGHTNTAYKVLRKLGLSIPLIGIAKKNEEIYFPYNSEPLKISSDNKALYLIQRIRDEAHRFAHSYHLLLREKVSRPQEGG